MGSKHITIQVSKHVFPLQFSVQYHVNKTSWNKLVWFSLCWFFLQTPKQLLRALLLAYSCKCPGFSSTRRACTETLKNHSHPIIKFLQCLLWFWSLLGSRNHLPLEYIFWALGHFQKLCLLLIRLHVTIITDTVCHTVCLEYHKTVVAFLDRKIVGTYKWIW